eukprot:TRINITY_DN677_c0_g1::TRINITY_DN677_c0_g1_i1::g.28801::m.28801 TRINITY_DN677_c0_g1::TRINITY_DN677_c0_g1_i1::g.28801  ORF type:complete len:859 (-),score=212.78,sp/Q54PQ4/GEFA_DICDI/36.55/4e-93,sp/Q54PQ4/GEFA_DICDI/47.37/8e-07,RasGEF/PF00617.14/6.1e+03,RasGEF/PF00617.14/7.7e-55,RasGEF_N/PF00618.15/1.6e-23 TRINITY_DN677_c0_g1_i1:289-2865(-)
METEASSNSEMDQVRTVLAPVTLTDAEGVNEVMYLPVPVPPNASVYYSEHTQPAIFDEIRVAKATILYDMLNNAQNSEAFDPSPFNASPAARQQPASRRTSMINPTYQNNIVSYQETLNTLFQAPFLDRPPAKRSKGSSTNDGRSEWMTRLYIQHPEIRELQERIDTVQRTAAFAVLYTPGRPAVKESVNDQALTRLIMQHLMATGCRASLEKYEKESGIGRPSTGADGGAADGTVGAAAAQPNQADAPATSQGSRLVDLVRAAMRIVEEVYHVTIQATPYTPLGGGEEFSADGRLRDLLGSLALKVEEDDAGPDICIWDEPSTPATLVLAPDRSIKAATLNKLVERLTIDKAPEGVDLGQYTKTFLMTFQSFTTPEKLLDKLLERFEVPVPASVSGDKEVSVWKTRVQQPIQLRVVNVLKTWIQTSFHHFNAKLINKVKGFVEYSLEPKSKEMAKMLSLTLEKKIQNKRNDAQIQHDMAAPDPVVDYHTIFSPSLMWTMIDGLEIARQLTLMEYDDYSAILPQELLDLAWSKAKLRYRAPNVLKMIHRSNSLSLWVVESIVAEPKLRLRAKIMEQFIKIAEHLFHLHNFNTCMAIYAGLNNSAVHRLQHTKSELPAPVLRSLEELERVLKAENNYRELRELLQNCAPPKIPFLGVYLTDLTFIEDGNKDFVTVRHVEYDEDSDEAVPDPALAIGAECAEPTVPLSERAETADSSPTPATTSQDGEATPADTPSDTPSDTCPRIRDEVEASRVPVQAGGDESGSVRAGGDGDMPDRKGRVVERELINFTKRELVAGVIKKIQLYQQSPYNLQAVRQVQLCLRKTLPRTTLANDEKRNNELYNLSIKVEPRNCQKSDLE